MTTMPCYTYHVVRVRFRHVAWDELRPGDVVYYAILRGRAAVPDDDPIHGPFTVVDPASGRLRNGQGVELPMARYKLQLMVQDDESERCREEPAVPPDPP